MNDLELMDLFTQFVSNDAAASGGDPTERVLRALRDRDRLQEISALRLTEPDVRHILRDIAREASSAVGQPVGLITIVLDDGVYVAAHHGTGGWLKTTGGTPLEWSFCRFTVAEKAPFVVNDAQRNALVQGCPRVTQDGLRCYAGMPLITSRGHAVGSLCVAGTEAREFSEAVLQSLQRLSTEAVRRIETRRVEVC